MALTGTPALEVKLILDDQLTGALRKVQADLDRLHRRNSLLTGVWQAGWRATGGVIVNLARNLFTVRNAFLAVGAAYTGIRLADHATKLVNLETGYKNLTSRIGGDHLAVLERLRGATKGTVSDMQLMQTANRAIMLGAVRSVDELDLLARTARRLGRAMGMDAGKAFDDLALAMGRMSPKVLDNLGVVVKLSEAQERYSKLTGRAVHELTAAERQAAFFNEAFRKQKDLLKSLGPDIETVTDKWGRVKATFTNIANEILKQFLPLLGKASEDTTQWFDDNRSKIFEFFASMVEAAAKAIPTIIDVLKELIDTLKTVFSWMGSITGAFAALAEYRAGYRLVENRDAYIAAGRKAAEGKGPGDPFYDATYAPYQRNYLGGIGTYTAYAQRTDDDTLMRLEEMYDRAKAGDIPDYVSKARGEYKWQLGEYDRINRMNLIAAGKIPPEPGLGTDFERTAAEVAAGLRKAGTISPKAIDKEGEVGNKIVDVTKEAAKAGTELDHALVGISDALQEIYFKGTDTFTQMKTLILGVSDALVDGLADGFTKALFAADGFKEAMKEMAKSIAEDLTKLIIKMFLMRMLSMALGGIFGKNTLMSQEGTAGDRPPVYAPFSGDVISNTGRGGLNMANNQDIAEVSTLSPGQMYSAKASGGPFGVFHEPTFFAETQPEAAVPLPDGRRIPVELLDDARGGVTNIYYVNAIDVKSFDERFNESASRNRGVIGKIASQQYQNDRATRRGFQS